jgi:hypothetical protein
MSSRGERPILWETLVQVSLKTDSSIVVGWTGGRTGAWRNVCSGVEFTQVRYTLSLSQEVHDTGGMVNNCIIKKLIN